jgi:soluble lytic murein transglycosylase-like protein
VSVEAAVARVGEIQAMLAQAGLTPPATQSATTTSFSDQLQAAAGSDGAVSAGATAASGGPVDGQFSDQINAAAQKYGIDPALLKGLIRQESGFNPNAKSPAGALGLTQLMPGTAAALGVSNPLDPAQAIEGGAKYLSQQLKAFGGDPRKALAAYNAGPGAVQRYGGVPPYAETQNYVRSVMAFADEYRRQSPSQPAAGSQAGSLSYSTT